MHRCTRSHIAGVLLVFWSVVAGNVTTADWPMQGGNPARTSYTPEKLPESLKLVWAYHCFQKPLPAWPNAQPLSYDHVLQPVTAGKTVFFGNSADCKVYALDAATGREKWSYFTAAPIRFAPVIWRDRVLVASDDGYLYCLSARDGAMLWRFRAGPDDRMILGNDRMISLWPVRGGPVVLDDKVYFTAGIWPSEKVFVCALDVNSGKLLWKNDSMGSTTWTEAHARAPHPTGLAFEGYLAATPDLLIAPTGWSGCALFGRGTGQYRQFCHRMSGGGGPGVVVGNLLFNLDSVYDLTSGAQIKNRFSAKAVAASPELVFLLETPGDPRATRIRLQALDAITPFVQSGESKRPNWIRNSKWTLEVPFPAKSLLAAGNAVIAGGGGKIAAFDLETRKSRWSADVEGTLCGLAFSDGQLYAGNELGVIRCFGAGSADAQEVRPPAPGDSTKGQESYDVLAQDILKQSEVLEGYCVDLGADDCRLALALARHSKLTVFALEADTAKVAASRRMLDSAGLLGTRITVFEGDPAKPPFPPYCADLIVSSRSATGRDLKLDMKEVERIQRPYGGVACFGKAGALRTTVRGKLDGAGSWTHAYADPANTSCSGDDILRGPLRVLWFAASDLETPDRHLRGPPPLVSDGELYVEGAGALRSVNAYNGRLRWNFPLPRNGAYAFNTAARMASAGRGSNFCLSQDSVFIRTGRTLYRLARKDGKQLGRYETPDDVKGGVWGYVCYSDGTLYATVSGEEPASGGVQLKCWSKELVAMDPETGKARWTYMADQAVRQNAIAIGSGKVFLVDRVPDADLPGSTNVAAGVLLALDAATGKTAWKVTNDVFGTVLTLSVKHDMLLMSYQFTGCVLPGEIGGRIVALRAGTGERVWEQKGKYFSRPVINDKTIYMLNNFGCPTFVLDLLKGDQRLAKEIIRDQGCGVLSSSSNLLLFRSAVLGYFDMSAGKETRHFGGIRPGCWINAIPAGGIVLMPDDRSQCTCAYLHQAWIALQPGE